MKKTAFILSLAALILAVFAVTAAADHEGHVEKKIKIKIKTDGDGLNLELDDFEVGETKQFFTENGKEVIVTRTEEAFKIEVEGKDEPIIVATHGVHGEHDYAYATGDSDGGEHHVVVKKIKHVGCDEDDSDCEHGPSMVFISKDGKKVMVGDGDGENVWVDGASGHGIHKIKIHGAHHAAQRLLDSGVLDDLPEAKRQEILEALKGGDEAHGVMMIDAEVHEEHEDH